MNLRGTGFRHTLPAVFSFSALWFIMLVLTPPIVTVSLMINGTIPPTAYSDVWFFLLTRMPIVVFAGIGLAILTTTRVAGPMVLLTRAFEDVTRGDLGRRLILRRGDRHFHGVETAFNEMMVSLNERAGSQGGRAAEDQVLTQPAVYPADREGGSISPP